MRGFKNIIFLLVLQLLVVQLYAQKTKGVVTYEVHKVNGYTWENKLDDQLKQGGDSTQISDLKDEIDTFLKSHSNPDAESNKQLWIYHFNANKARIIGNQLFRRETFDIYHYKTNDRVIRRFHKGNKDDFRIDTINYSNRLKYNNYKTTIHRDSLKYIGDYKCYKIEIEEINNRHNEPIKTTYEIYVTDEINFPMNPIIELPETVTKHCAVEIKTWVNDEKRNYMHYKLVSYQSRLKRKLLKIPNKYKGT